MVVARNLCLLLTTTEAFGALRRPIIPRAQPTASPKKPVDGNMPNYSDDAFGLVIAAGVFIAKDVVFSSAFVGLSGAAAVATRKRWLPSDPIVPSLVAAVSVLASTCVHADVAQVARSDAWAELLKPTSVAETAACTVSCCVGAAKSVLARSHRTD